MYKSFLFLFSFFVGILFFAKDVAAQDNTTSDTTVYNVVDNKPVFQGDIYVYIKSHTHYPESVIESGIEGTVYLSFVISKKGEVKDVEVEKGLSPELDAEAVRMVKSMPAWIPGKQNGVLVNVRMHLPVKFVVDKANKLDTNVGKMKGPVGNRKGIYVIPYIGLGPGTVVTNIQFGIIGGGVGVGGVRTAFCGGGGIGYMLNNHLGAFVGAQVQKYYEPYSYSVYQGGYTSLPNGSLQDTALSINVKYYFTYLQIPLLFEYITGKPEHPSFHVEGGFLFGLPIYVSEAGIVNKYVQTYSAQSLSNPFGSQTPVNTEYEQVNFASTPTVYKSDNGMVLNFGIMIPLSYKYSLSVDVATLYKFSTSIGNGSNDQVSFDNVLYRYFQGEYGEANSYLVDLKLFIHLGKIKIDDQVPDQK